MVGEVYIQFSKYLITIFKINFLCHHSLFYKSQNYQKNQRFDWRKLCTSKKKHKQLFFYRTKNWRIVNPIQTEIEIKSYFSIEKLSNWHMNGGIALSPKIKVIIGRNKLKNPTSTAWSAVKCHFICFLSASFHRCLQKYWKCCEILNFNLLWNQWTTDLNSLPPAHIFSLNEWYQSVAIRRGLGQSEKEKIYLWWFDVEILNGILRLFKYCW